MSQLQKPTRLPIPYREPFTSLAIQAPLPDFDHTLPKLISIRGRGAVSGATAPPPPPKEADNGC